MAGTEKWRIAGLGYSGGAVARALVQAGVKVTATARDPAARAAPLGIALIAFAAAAPAIQDATHLLVTAPPSEAGDPLLALHAEAIAAAMARRWIGGLSSGRLSFSDKFLSLAEVSRIGAKRVLIGARWHSIGQARRQAKRNECMILRKSGRIRHGLKISFVSTLSKEIIPNRPPRHAAVSYRRLPYPAAPQPNRNFERIHS